jgi:cyclophilin family peptidyl-prolyl cis-trans isomerase/protein-disulfide isomerase
MPLALLVPLMLVGCDSQTASPSPTPSLAATSTPPGPASCYLIPLNFYQVSVPPITESDHVHGPADAAVTIIEYADFQCPGCAAMVTLREYLADAHGDNVRFAYRHFLLDYHQLAQPTAEAVEAAGAQGSFWEMHDLLYNRRDEWLELTEDGIDQQLVAYADELGLDTERFAADMENDTHLEGIMADDEAARAASLPGTPTYVVNGVIYPSSELGLHPVLVSAFPRLMQMQQYSALPPQVIEQGKDYVATISTGKGDIVIELFPDLAPTNTNAFAFLAQDGWYDGRAFFSVSHDWVAQAGDPMDIGWGMPFSGFYCEDEINSNLSFDEAGILALYGQGEGVTVTEFFISYVPLSQLNGKYTIIGRVIEGMDVLQSLTETTPDIGQPDPDVIASITVEER